MLKIIDQYLDPTKVDEKTIEDAYQALKEYCSEQKLDIIEFLENTDNIAPAAAHIHKELPMAYRLVLKKDKIAKLITENLEFIQEKALFYYEKEHGKKKKTTKKTTKK